MELIPSRRRESRSRGCSPIRITGRNRSLVNRCGAPAPRYGARATIGLHIGTGQHADERQQQGGRIVALEQAKRNPSPLQLDSENHAFGDDLIKHVVP